MENHVKKGIFIRHTATSSHIYYWDTGTYPVNNYKHVWFDEGINDLEIQNPNSRQLWISLCRPLSEDQEEAPIIIPPNIDSQHAPFTIIHDVSLRVMCYHDNLGVILGSYSDRDRVYLKYVILRTSCSKIKG